MLLLYLCAYHTATEHPWTAKQVVEFAEWCDLGLNLRLSPGSVDVGKDMIPGAKGLREQYYSSGRRTEYNIALYGSPSWNSR